MVAAERVGDVVVGSGPTGWAAARAIADGGGHALVIDFGAAPAYAGATYDKASTIALKGDLARMRVFDYPRTLVASRDGRQLPLSSARGGLSAIWGAGILLRSAEDMPELDEAGPGVQAAYGALLDAMPAAGAADALSRRFPWPEGTEVAPQSQRFTRMLQQYQPDAHPDVLLGHPRVSLQAGRCIRAGACLNGCPLDLFFSAATALRQLEAAGGCTLVPGPVRSLEPEPGGVVLVLPDRRLLAERVLLAAGPIGTPALLQRSRLAPDQLVARDSAVFYAGLVNLNAVSGDEADYTAAQAVAYSGRPGSEDFQVSLYESNPDYLERLRALAPALGRLAGGAAGLTGRINAAIGFLDSSVSGTLTIAHRHGRSIVTRSVPRGAAGRARAVMRRVGRTTRPLGLVPLPGVVLVPSAGSGYHTGSALPMGRGLVDLHGRLVAAPRVHVVDASSLPKVWAGSHTFTAMANAYRIARA